MGILFLNFCFLCILGECDSCVLPDRKFCLDTIGVGTGSFKVKCVSGYWEPTLRNWCLKGFTEGREQGVQPASPYLVSL